eukprot:Gregarina_sp_Poly_1__6129@NODE_323_length_9530_cov_14_322836_g275_i0_p5_GENE_NODE_323_length_9530_cov_14_322836_g275_i0NODE_323_length_9530_cov_14_322836_g275_i0_p5_ORF_typecomplete_len296_score41_25NT5C/PF06941_12/2e27HAD_2/PF13419_6/5_6e05Acid_phosphat_B/PF03767_14/0_00089NIF/PF03031_18/0_004HAD_SAK_2/PF18143_1/0_24HAD_SAK_2/PF18143_1/1_3e03_NODE_323_length_9530_cov_14_322836_g275_i037454632
MCPIWLAGVVVVSASLRSRIFSSGRSGQVKFFLGFWTMLGRDSKISDLPVLALDIDEVLANTLEQSMAWHNNTYGTSLTKEDYKSYIFCEVWNCTDAEAMQRFREFTRSPYWEAIQPVEGAQQFVNEMSSHFRLAIVTSRQDFLQESTLRWLNLYFGLHKFCSIKFGNNWLADENAAKKSKREMCMEIGAVALIDDLPKHILHVSPVRGLRLLILGANTNCKVVKKAILFNLNREQPWSLISEDTMSQYTNVCLCTTWDEVYSACASLSRSLESKISGAPKILDMMAEADKEVAV